MYIAMFKTLKRKLSPAPNNPGQSLKSRNSLAPPPSQFGSLLAPPPTQFGSVLAPTLRQARSFNDLAVIGCDSEDEVCGDGCGGSGELGGERVGGGSGRELWEGFGCWFKAVGRGGRVFKGL